MLKPLACVSAPDTYLIPLALDAGNEVSLEFKDEECNGYIIG
jgi:hypothetical protein